MCTLPGGRELSLTVNDEKGASTADALAANANVVLDDFLLFDVAKPISDQS